jgi:Family of unknown function (DUF5719)
VSSRSTVGAALVVAATAAAVAGVGTPPRISGAEPTPSVVAVTGTDLGCPALPHRGDTTVVAVAPTSTAGAVAGTASTTSAAAAVRVVSVNPHTGPRTFAESARAGQLRHRVRGSDGAALAISARGAFAPGATGALVSSRFGGNQGAGLSAGWCATPATSWWFTGVDTSVGSTSLLTLTNISPTPAVVDLAFFGRRGPIDVPGTRGIAVPGRSQRSLDLAGFAPGAAALTTHVSTERGAVSASVRTVALSGVTAVGSDWISPAVSPSTSLVVGPAPAGSGRRQLVLTNPGQREALAAIRIVDPSGAFTSTQLPNVRVAPGAVVVADVTALLDRQPGAVDIASNVALTAALTTRGRGRRPDFATVGATAALTAPAVVPLFRDTEQQVLFTTAGRTGARVEVAMFDGAADRVRRARFEVQGRAIYTLTMRQRSPVDYLVVVPQQGAAVHAVAYYRNEGGLAALPAVSGQWSIRLPVVRPAS